MADFNHLREVTASMGDTPSKQPQKPDVMDSDTVGAGSRRWPLLSQLHEPPWVVGKRPTLWPVPRPPAAAARRPP